MNLITPSDLSVSQIIRILDYARYPDYENRQALQLAREQPYRKKPWLATAFFEPSTRTKLSFHAAASDAGFRVLDLPESSSLTKGETQEDTVRNMLEISDIAVMVIRSKDESLIHRMAEEYPEVDFINAGNGASHHPTQALGDLLTLAEHFEGWRNLPGKILTILGDVQSSRVANSCKELFEMFNMTVCFGGPKDLLPTPPYTDSTPIYESKGEALEASDVVMMLRIQHERKRFPSDGIDKARRERQMREWKVTEEDLSRYPDLRVMHPGPVNRGVELTDEALDGMQSLVLKQVRSGYLMRRALLEILLEDRQTALLRESLG